MNLTDLAVLSGVVVGLTQIFKVSFEIPNRYTPIANLVIGIGLSLLFIGVSRNSALLGIFAALSASGIYSSGKSVAGY